jgi:hypothetical protein
MKSDIKQLSVNATPRCLKPRGRVSKEPKQLSLLSWVVKTPTHEIPSPNSPHTQHNLQITISPLKTHLSSFFIFFNLILQLSHGLIPSHLVLRARQRSHEAQRRTAPSCCCWPPLALLWVDIGVLDGEWKLSILLRW